MREVRRLFVLALLVVVSSLLVWEWTRGRGDSGTPRNQRAALEDGTVDRVEYLSAFESFLECAAGMVDVVHRDARSGFAWYMYSDRVADNVDSCYRVWLNEIDYVFQTTNSLAMDVIERQDEVLAAALEPSTTCVVQETAPLVHVITTSTTC